MKLFEVVKEFHRPQKLTHLDITQALGYLIKHGGFVRIRGDEPKRKVAHEYARRRYERLETCREGGWVYMWLAPEKCRTKGRRPRQFELVRREEVEAAQKRANIISSRNLPTMSGAGER